MSWVRKLSGRMINFSNDYMFIYNRIDMRKRLIISRTGLEFLNKIFFTGFVYL